VRIKKAKDLLVDLRPFSYLLMEELEHSRILTMG
jgi:hypothetical protein